MGIPTLRYWITPPDNYCCFTGKVFSECVTNVQRAPPIRHTGLMAVRI
nr:MAG TPA: hypothetical protein [Caudoviricetes sp.]